MSENDFRILGHTTVLDSLQLLIIPNPLNMTKVLPLFLQLLLEMDIPIIVFLSLLLKIKQLPEHKMKKYVTRLTNIK